MTNISRDLHLVAMVSGVLFAGQIFAAPFSLQPERAALYRLYSGDKLIGEFATKEEVDAAAINAVSSCTDEVNYVYTETVAAVNSECETAGQQRGSPAPAGQPGKEASAAQQSTRPPLRKDAPAAEKKKPAPAVNTPNDTKAVDERTPSPPPATDQAPAGKPSDPTEGLLIIPYLNNPNATPQRDQ